MNTSTFRSTGQFLIKRLMQSTDPQTSMKDYFDAVVRHRTSPNGVFGVKAHSNQCLPHYQSGFIPWYFGEIKHVLIRRRDVLGQAISLVIAGQTGKWTSHEKQTKQAVYSHEAIDKSLQLTAYYNDLWDRFFTTTKIVPLPVFYEDLLDQPTEEIQRVVDFVGVDSKVSISLEDAGLEREATALNQEWRERFESESK